MKIRSPTVIKLIAYLTSIILPIWFRTLRFQTTSLSGKRHPTDPNQERHIYAFWHESLLAPAAVYAPVRVLISQHRDGEFIAQICHYLGIGVVRGSTTRGGAQALLELVSGNEGTHLAITPDGPKGPRRVVQLGTVFLASQTGISVVPIGVGFGWAWRAKSWDRFAVPVPFSKIYGVFGRPIFVPADAHRSVLENFRTALEQSMLSVTLQAEAWASSNKPPPTTDG